MKKREVESFIEKIQNNPEEAKIAFKKMKDRGNFYRGKEFFQVLNFAIKIYRKAKRQHRNELLEKAEKSIDKAYKNLKPIYQNMD